MNQYELLNLEFVLKQIRFKELLSKDEINGFRLRFHSERNLQQYSIERNTIEYEIRSTINELETLLQFYFFNETSKKALDEIIVENKINEDWYTRHNWILNELMLEFIYFTEKTPIIDNNNGILFEIEYGDHIDSDGVSEFVVSHSRKYRCEYSGLSATLRLLDILWKNIQ